MTGSLTEFQNHFARVVRGDVDALGGVTSQPGFAVYRNTVMKGCIDALEANFPSVRRIVGDEWFRAAAAIYVRNRLPSSPVLLEYGADFDEFLSEFEPAAELPYLSAVATLDRFWTEAHIAADEEMLDAAWIAGLDANALASLRLRPHGSARWAWFEHAPVASVWCRNRDSEAADLGDVVWRGEGVLIVRSAQTVESFALGCGDCAFLDACTGSVTLAEAAARALAADPDTDLAALMRRLLESGAFASHKTEGARP